MTKGLKCFTNTETSASAPRSLRAGLPARDRLAQVWGEQMLQAGSSVGANYREAQRGRSVAEYRSKIGDCLREADEALYWMELLELDGYFKPAVITPLMQETGELIAIFVSLLWNHPSSG